VSRPLDAAEIADAAMSAALVMGLLTTGRLLAAGTAFQILATIVLAVLAARRRLRVVAVATAAAMALAVLLGGIGPISQAFISGVFGYAGGLGLRRRSSLLGHVSLSLVIGWPIVSAVSLGFLTVFSGIRRITLENVTNQGHGIAEIFEAVRLDGVAGGLVDFVDWSVEHWWLMVPLTQVGIAVGYSLLVRRIGRAVLDRVDSALGAAVSLTVTLDEAEPDPLPITLADVTIDYGTAAVALSAVDTTIEAGQAVALVGANGSGKTSLIDALAGIAPATGITTSGRIGLGRHAGTSLIGQRPESQVLGIRVIDDMRWGLDPSVDPLVLLEQVGLDDRSDQPTSELSGGELQRLAIAAALAREPALLLSDESTAMLDPLGRAEVTSLMLEAAAAGAAVIHSTHLATDIENFDRRLRLDDQSEPTPHRWISHPGSSPTPLLIADDLGYVHNAGTPWARRVLSGVEMVVGRGELIAVIGSNGSGKTTLARILAGLLQPTEGTLKLEDEPLLGPSPRIGIAFQHARLQLLRSRVRSEVLSLAGHDNVDSALEIVGFDPDEIGPRRVDELSAGQQRLVLLAGMIARACDVAILDEPLAGLDPEGRERLAHALDTLLARGTGVVVISHDPDWALERSDAVLDLDRLSMSWGAP
jgi:energy-coupling factor transporter ATP-binding protein EcfA2